MQQRNNPEHHRRVTNEFYNTAGGVDDRLKPKCRPHTRPSIDIDVPTSIDRRAEFGKRAYNHDGTRGFHWDENDEYGVYRDDHGHARDVDGHIIHVSDDIFWKELQWMSTTTYVFQNMLAQEKNIDNFQMKLDGVYYPLNDSISWLTTCMEVMRQDIARMQTQRAAKATTPASIDENLPTSIDTDPSQSNPMKSQPDSYTRAEIDQMVEEIYKTLGPAEERLDRRCNDIYFPWDITITLFTSHTEAMQREIVDVGTEIRTFKSEPRDRTACARSSGNRVPVMETEHVENNASEFLSAESSESKKFWADDRYHESYAVETAIHELGAENLFIQQRNISEHHQRVANEFYNTSGEVDDHFKPKYQQHTRQSINIGDPTSIERRPEFGKEPMTVMELGDSTGRRRMSMEST
ncbi:hypothetical protein F2Q68_00039617 [Brassica cretica]|uniref:Uncharacterized protein n=1 Tax=Brassica cretica TaxID=69181 RepID=A0A8S9M936_BRACR|nr:hypothetical protein F2Q68_00039617 [Brassica cretica]